MRRSRHRSDAGQKPKLNLSRSENITVRFFEELYAIVVGLGLALAIEQIVDLDKDGLPILVEHLPVFLAYLNIAFPLAHSSVRYLELAYVDKDAGALSKQRVLGDLALGMGHFLFLLSLSFLVTRPAAFAGSALLLLIGRPARDVLISLGRGTVLPFDRKVAHIHVLAMILLGITLIAAAPLNDESEVWTARIGILITSLIYAIGLYLWAFEYFFSDNETEAAGRVD